MLESTGFVGANDNLALSISRCQIESGLSVVLVKVLNFVESRFPDSFANKFAPKIQSISSNLVSNSTNGKSARTAMLVFLVRIISAVLAFMLQVFLARWMGSQQYGVFVLVWVVCVMAGAMSCLGLQTAIIRFITEYRARNDTKRLNGILLAAPGIAISFATCLALVAFMVLSQFGENITTIELMPLYLALFCLPLLALEEIQEGIARSFEMPVIAIGPAFIIRPAGILITMTFAYLLGFPANATTAMVSAVVGTYLATLIQSSVLWLGIHRLHQINFPTKHLAGLLENDPSAFKFQFRYWVSVALPIFLASGFYGLLFNSDVVLIGMMLGPDAVAIYYAALKCLAFAHFVQFAFRAASTHHFSRFYADNDIRGLGEYANKIAKWTFWPTLLIAVAIISSGKYILMLFGPEFVEGENLLIILALGIVLRASVGPIDALLAMTGQQQVAMWVLAITLISNIILNVFLIPLYGVFGAAIATSCVMVIETAFMYVAVNRKLGIHVFVFNFRNGSLDERLAT